MTDFLISCTLGMFPGTPYTKTKNANGYIIVKDDGNLVAYHAFYESLIREHVFKCTKFDTPAEIKLMSAKLEKQQRDPFCRILKSADGSQELKLNFQIRWMLPKKY